MGSASYFEDQVIYNTRKITTVDTEKSHDLTGQHLKQLNVLDYQIELKNLSNKDSVYERGIETESLKIPLAGFEIKLHRKWRKYIIYYYMPSGLIAIISCVSINILQFLDKNLKMLGEY